MAYVSNLPAGASGDRSAPFNQPDDVRQWCVICGDVPFNTEDDIFIDNGDPVCETCKRERLLARGVQPTPETMSMFEEVEEIRIREAA